MEILNPTSAQIEEIINKEAEQKFDKIVEPKEFSSREERAEKNILYFAKGNKVIFADSALQQLLARLRIPKNFYDRCPVYLKRANLEYFNKQFGGTYMFRFLKPDLVRAVLSDKYGTIDDKDLFPVLSNIFSNRDDLTYVKMQSDMHLTRFLLQFRDCTCRQGGREYHAGLSVINSETGHSSLWVEPVVFFDNFNLLGRRTLSRQGVECRIIHRGEFAFDKVPGLIEQAKEIAQVGIYQLAEQMDNQVQSSRVVDFIRNSEALPNRFAEIIEEEWANQERIVMAEALSKLLSMIQELPLFQRTQAEQEVGNYTGIFGDYRRRFQDIMETINAQ